MLGADTSLGLLCGCFMIETCLLYYALKVFMAPFIVYASIWESVGILQFRKLAG